MSASYHAYWSFSSLFVFCISGLEILESKPVTLEVPVYLEYGLHSWNLEFLLWCYQTGGRDVQESDKLYGHDREDD